MCTSLENGEKKMQNRIIVRVRCAYFIENDRAMKQPIEALLDFELLDSAFTYIQHVNYSLHLLNLVLQVRYISCV